MHDSDRYHPVIGFDAEAYDSIDGLLRNYRGYGVTLTLEDDSQVEAVLAGPYYDEKADRLLVEFYRVTDWGKSPTIESVPPESLERVFAKRIQVA